MRQGQQHHPVAYTYADSNLDADACAHFAAGTTGYRDAGTHAAAVALARLPETIRGYGPVKERSVAAAKAKRGELMAAFERNDVAEVIAA